MNFRLPEFIKSQMPAVVCIVVLGAGLWLAPAGRWDLWGPDEARYTLIARELLRGENPFFLTVNGKPYPDKPFLPFWMIAAALAPAGGEVDERLARLPAILMALGVVLMTWRIGVRRWGGRAGALAAVMLFTSHIFTEEAVAVRLDMPLTFWVTLGVFALAQGRRSDAAQPGAPGPLAPAAAAVFWLAMGGAMLTKGPVALLFPLGWLAGEAWAARSPRPLWRIALLPGALFIATLMGWWLWTQTRLHPPEFVAEQTTGQLLPRLFHPEHHVRPPWFFIQKLFLSVFVPWSPFFAVALAHQWRSRKSGAPRHTPALAAALGWIAVPFVILSIIPGKREQYILPLLPGAALVTGWYMSEVLWPRAMARFVRWPFGALGAVLALGVLGVGVCYGLEKSILEQYGFDLGKNEGYVLIALGAALLIPAGLLAAARTWGRFTAALALIALAAAGLQTWFFNPAINNRKSARAFNLYLAQITRPAGGVAGALDGEDKAEYQAYTTVRFQKVHHKQMAENGGAGIDALPPVIFGKNSQWDLHGEVFRNAGYSLASDFFRAPDELSVYVHEDRLTSAAHALADAKLNAGEPLRFFFFGDAGEPNARLHRLIAQTMDRHRQRPATAAFLLGDNAYLWYPAARLMDECFVEPFLPLLREGVPFHAIFGNHDNDVEGLKEYQMNFPLLGMGGRNYYVASYGDGLADFIGVDTTTLDDEGDPGQRAWLREALHSARARWKILLIHKPPFATDYSHGPSAHIQALLDNAGWREAGADAVISGDNHWYEHRGDVPGVLLFVNGGASQPQRKALPKKGHEFRVQYESRRATALQFDITREALRFEAYTERGKIVDEGEVRK